MLAKRGKNLRNGRSSLGVNGRTCRGRCDCCQSRSDYLLTAEDEA